jgi:primosomal protein N' (replication factor Y)
MDRDTTRRKGALLALLKGLSQRTIDILVGTQMVAKGHDYPAITLVGILCADLSLSFPDFRAGERTFQLLAQVAGRAGRGHHPGQVYLQTYNPDHFSIDAARRQDFKAFYDHEIGFREALHYPPFARLILLKVAGRHKQETAAVADALGSQCRRLKQRSPAGFKTVEIMGPIESSLPRVAGRFRWQLLLKGTSAFALHAFVGRLMTTNPALFSHRRIRVAVDVDPVFMM